MRKLFGIIIAIIMVAFVAGPAIADTIQESVSVTAQANAAMVFSVDEAAIDFTFLDNATGWQTSSPADLNLNMLFGASGYTSTISTNLAGGQATAWLALCTANGVRMTLDDTTYAGFVAGPVNLIHGAIGSGPEIFNVATPVDFTGQAVQLEIDAEAFMAAGFTDPYSSQLCTLWFEAITE